MAECSSATHNEHTWDECLRKDILHQLETRFSPEYARQLMVTAANYSGESIEKIFRLKREEISNEFEMNLRKQCGDHAINAQTSKEVFSFLHEQLDRRFQVWKAVATSSAEMDKFTRTVRDAEIELKQRLDETCKLTTRMNPLQSETLAISNFENIWNKQFAQIQALFSRPTRWQQIFILICSLYQTFNNIASTDLNKTLHKVLLCLDMDSLNDCKCPTEKLYSLRDMFLCVVSDVKPIVPEPFESQRKKIDYDHLSSFMYLDRQELLNIWLDEAKLKPTGEQNIMEQKYQRICEKIIQEWPLFIQTFQIFEDLMKQFGASFSSRSKNDLTLDALFIQEISAILHSVLKQADSEFNTFQLRMSNDLLDILHAFTMTSIALFYHTQQTRYFDVLVQNVQRDRELMLGYFLRITLPTLDGTANVAKHFLSDICSCLKQSFETEIKKITETEIAKETTDFNRARFAKNIEEKIKLHNRDWLMRYITCPVDLLNEWLDQRSMSFKHTMERHIDYMKSEYCELIDELARIGVTINRLLQSKDVDSTTVIDSLFETSSDIKTESIQNKRFCMALLVFQHLSGQEILNEIKYASGSSCRVNPKWHEILRLPSISSDTLKQAFRSISWKFEVYAAWEIDQLLAKISQQATEAKSLLAKYIDDFKKEIVCLVQRQLRYKQQGCIIQCPGCQRLCDIDHSLYKFLPIGQHENRHCCMPNHHIQAMGGWRHAKTNEACVTSCEQTDNKCIIIDQQSMIQQNWGDFKKKHRDWNFDDAQLRINENNTTIYIWKMIGEQLCEYYGNTMKFVTFEQSLIPDHVFIIYGHSTDLNVEDNSPSQYFLRKIVKRLSQLFTNDDERWSNIEQDLSISIAAFISLIKQVDPTIRTTMIVNDSSATAGSRAVQLEGLDSAGISDLLRNCCRSIDFNGASTLIDDIINKTQIDSQLNRSSRTVILLTYGKSTTLPLPRLLPLTNDFHSKLTSFWIIALDNTNTEPVVKIQHIRSGETILIDESSDLQVAFERIVNDWKSKTSTSLFDNVSENYSTVLLGDQLLPRISTESSYMLDDASKNTSHLSTQKSTTYAETIDFDCISIPCIPEDYIYHEIYDVPLPCQRKHVLPDVLAAIGQQAATTDTTERNTLFIPLPVLSQRSIDHLPTIRIHLQMEPNVFDCDEFLNCLAQDLSIDCNHLVIVEAKQGTVSLTIKLSWDITIDREKVDDIQEKLVSMNIPITTRFAAIKLKQERSNGPISSRQNILVQLEKFNRIDANAIRLTPETIATSLQMSRLRNVQDQTQFQFLQAKSQQIANCLMHAFQECAFEYTLENALLICNIELLNQYKAKYGKEEHTEKILFHGTRKENFQGIFQRNFQYEGINVQRSDDGWFGKGIYFSSSPRKALQYAKSWKFEEFAWIICCVVVTGKSLTITNMDYKGKNMHRDYDSHYVRTKHNGDPVTSKNEPFYEEFVIKNNDRILPLFTVALRRAYRCAIWRDMNIESESNTAFLFDFRLGSPFNIYSVTKSENAFKILEAKRSKNEIRCVVITNGADDGEQFVSRCRRQYPDIQVAVFCKKKDYHKQWTQKLAEPEILVTGNAKEVLQYIKDTLK
ncbi:unnamed protein product [Adineta ricciae]|uniref:Poly [ADP-ribose] polymerase n=1 Tax=Adineta ricciae TaxID=249248 RepID=A0A815KU32_ADIRI|nr:unnamed protein product [Adineta ricciae]CAF1394311.1 unnamed protein product [Adineta ricciae]